MAEYDGRWLTHGEHPLKVDGHDRVPFLFGHVENPDTREDARVVYEVVNATQTFLVSHPAVARYVMFDFSDYTSTERVSEVMVNPEGILSPGVVAEYPVPAPAAHADGDVRLSEGS